MQKKDMQKYKELFEQSRYVNDEELKRGLRVYDSASKLLSALTLLIAFVGFIFKWSMENFLPPEHTIDYLGLIALMFTICLFSISWLYSFLAYRGVTLRKMPINEAMIKFFEENSLDDIYYALTKRFAEAYEENKVVIDKKQVHLGKCANLIICFFMSALILLILVGSKNFVEPKNMTMSHNKNAIILETNKEIGIKAEKGQLIIRERLNK